MARALLAVDNLAMDGVGQRLRFRALELGMSDAEVARRTGLTATRYGHYVTDYREPDLATLVRICRVLGLRPDEVLSYEQPGNGPDHLAERRRQIAGLLEVMNSETLDLAGPVVAALAATQKTRAPVAAKVAKSRAQTPRRS